MSTSRMEAFSDGVLAILITIMVIELPTPHGASWAALHDAVPVLFAYALSFVYLGIYWSNHHHMLQATDRVSGVILWANLHLLFWLSLVPFVTAWMGENSLAAVPAAAYGIVMLASAVAYYVLQQVIIRDQGESSLVAVAVGRDRKGKLSPYVYASAIALAFVEPWLSVALYVAMALVWLVPDRRIERTVTGRASGVPHDGAGD